MASSLAMTPTAMEWAQNSRMGRAWDFFAWPTLRMMAVDRARFLTVFSPSMMIALVSEVTLFISE